MAVGDVYWSKSFLVFTTSKPYVEVEAGEGRLHKFSLQTDFEARVDQLHQSVSGSI